MFLSLSSSSDGNCTLVSDGKTAVLADCGISQRRLEQGLSSLGMTCRDLCGIVITHEHSDHIKGAEIVSKRYNLPIFASAKTHERMNFKDIPSENIKCISPDTDFEIGTIGVKPFSIPHDAADPLGYSFFSCGKKLSLATDIGKMNDYILGNLKGSIAVILESNHDIDMLKNGRYPIWLKRRILGDFGHLSNDAAADTVARLLENGTEYFMLAHLSKDNNMPELAFSKVAEGLKKTGAAPGQDVHLCVASRYGVTNFR